MPAGNVVAGFASDDRVPIEPGDLVERLGLGEPDEVWHDVRVRVVAGDEVGRAAPGGRAEHEQQRQDPAASRRRRRRTGSDRRQRCGRRRRRLGSTPACCRTAPVARRWHRLRHGRPGDRTGGIAEQPGVGQADRRRTRQLLRRLHQGSTELRSRVPIVGQRPAGALEHGGQRAEVGRHRHQTTDAVAERGDSRVAGERHRARHRFEHRQAQRVDVALRTTFARPRRAPARHTSPARC